MQTTTQGIELTVAILMDDMGCAKEIANALRHQNILAHLYQTLDEYWVASSLQTPDLTIIDVIKMSQGSVQFRSHPKVIEGSLSYAFFSKDSTKVLLQSTFGLNPLGYIHLDASLNIQIGALITRRINEIESMKIKNELEGRIQRLQARSQRFISERSEAEEFRAHFSFIKKICGEIEAESTRLDFTKSLLGKLEKWDAIDAYGVYELGQSGQKLISPEASKKKHHSFPSLWLGEINQQGIEGFAQEMAIQVANDLFEIAPVCLKVYSGAANPEILVYLSFREERMMNFPWEVLESLLSSSYRKLKLYQKLPHYSSQFLPMWEALDMMDKMQTVSLDQDSRIVALSLLPLTDMIKKRTNNKFFWSSFFNDFFLQLSGRLKKTTKVSLFGPWHVLLFIPREDIETETQMLQSFVKEFSYWKFFEDNSNVLSVDMLPVLKLIPPSSNHYLRIFEKEFSDLELKEQEKRLMLSPKDAKRITL